MYSTWFYLFFCFLAINMTVSSSLLADGEAAAKHADYISALEALEDKKFEQILVHELKAFLLHFPEAEKVAEMHFKMATIYHDNKKENDSFFQHLSFLYLYPNSRFEAPVRDRLRALLVQEKKYTKMKDKIEPLLNQDFSGGEKEFAAHAFLRDAYELQFEPFADLLREACENFLFIYPKSIKADEVLFWRGELLAADKKPREALSHFLKLTYLHNNSLYATSSKLKMAEILSDQLDQHQKAILTLEEFLLEHPNDPQASQAQFKIGKIQEKHKKKYIEAINSYTAVAQKYPKSVEAVPALFDAAKLYEDKFDEYDQAIRIYTEVVRDFPNDMKAPHAMAYAATIYEKKLKDFHNAAAVYYKVFGLYPGSAIAPQSLFAAAEINEEKLQDLDKALEYYRQLTEKYPADKLTSKANKRIAKISKRLVSE